MRRLCEILWAWFVVSAFLVGVTVLHSVLLIYLKEGYPF